MAAQLVLPLVQSVAAPTLDNFYPGPNQVVLDHLRQMVAGHGERVIYLAGPSSSGRSHLLQACCLELTTLCKRSCYLPLAESGSITSVSLQGLDALDVVVIDDLQQVAGIPAWDEALFHLYNQTMQSGTFLLVSANVLPGQLHNTLPDLRSRWEWGLVLQIKPLSDTEKKQALLLHAKSRGLELSQVVLDYLLRHYARDMKALSALFDILDQTVWQTQKRLTIPVVKQVLQQCSEREGNFVS